MWVDSEGMFDMAKQIFAHVVMIRLGMIGGRPTYSSRLKSDDLTEIELLVWMETNQFVIKSQGGASRGQSQHAMRFPAQKLCNDLRSQRENLFGCITNQDFHGCPI